MKRFFCFLLTLSFPFAYEAPVRNPSVVSFLGDSRGDHFHNGVDYRGENIAAYPIADMKALYAYHEEDDPTRASMGYGNFVVLEDEKKIRAHYVHLSKIFLSAEKTKVNNADLIGLTGNSGHSYGGHLHLTLFDLKNKSFISALSLMEQNKIDDKPPIVASLFTILNNKVYSFKEKKGVLRRVGAMDLFAIISDPFYIVIDGKKYLREGGVKQIDFFVDSVLKKHYDFSLLMENKEKKEIALSTGETFSEVYGKKRNYKLGSFTPSKSEHLFRLHVKDWAGNETNKEYLMSFQ